MKMKFNFEKVVLIVTILVVSMFSIIAFADIQTLQSMGLGWGNPLVPDYYLDYTTIPSFASLEYATTTGLNFDIPAEISISTPTTYNGGTWNEIYPTIVYETNIFSLAAYLDYYNETYLNYTNQISSYQYTYLQVNPSINFGNIIAAGLDGAVTYNTYNSPTTSFNVELNGGLNGAIKFGSTLMGVNVQTQPYYSGNNFSFSPSVTFLSQTLFNSENGFRIFEYFQSYTGGYYDNGGLSYFNSNGKNISGIALTGNMEEDSYYSSSNQLELSYCNVTLDPFIQRKIGDFEIRAGLPLNYSYNNPNYNSSGTYINLTPSFGMTYDSPLGDFNLYYINSNFTILPIEGDFNIGFSYNTNF